VDPKNVTFPIFIGNAIAARLPEPEGEIFYSRLVTIPDPLPAGGRFYFSSQPDKVAEIFVDDRIVIMLDGVDVFWYQSVLGKENIVEIPRPVMAQIAGKPVVVEYRDMFGAVLSATDVWLIWVP
jgi:hypothetical protein